MRAVLTVRANDRYARAIAATADLLSRLKLTCTFVGNVARSAWLHSDLEDGSIDALALMTPEQKNQVAMMGSNRGFAIDRGEIERSEELDLIPMRFDGIRIHVLVASNALYASIVNRALPAGAIRVASAEDLALLLSLGDDPAAEMLIRLPEFDRRAYNERLVSIGLPQMVVAE
jgi:hypothetical protein